MSKKRRRTATHAYHRQPYVEWRQANPPPGPGVYHLIVRHDDWCDLLCGRGLCNCNPDIERQREQ